MYHNDAFRHTRTRDQQGQTHWPVVISCHLVRDCGFYGCAGTRAKAATVAVNSVKPSPVPSPSHCKRVNTSHPASKTRSIRWYTTLSTLLHPAPGWIPLRSSFKSEQCRVLLPPPLRSSLSLTSLSSSIPTFSMFCFLLVRLSVPMLMSPRLCPRAPSWMP